MPQPDTHSASELLIKLCIDTNVACEAYVAHGTHEMRRIEVGREGLNDAVGIKGEGHREEEEDTAGEEEDDMDWKEAVEGINICAAFVKVR